MFSASDLTLGINTIISTAQSMPKLPGVYKMLSADYQVLYVGKAKILPKRVMQYVQINNMAYRLQLMVSLIRNIEFFITNSEEEALLLEANFIKFDKPKFNIVLKDDKSYPFLAIDEKHLFPRIFKHYGHTQEGIIYYGPFTNIKHLDLLRVELEKIFTLRSCTDQYFATRKRPCLLYQIARCSAPCIQKINTTHYNDNVQQAKQFLAGKTKSLQTKLIQEMEQASAKLKFEKAALLRDRIKAISTLSKLQDSSAIIKHSINNADIFSFHNIDSYYCMSAMLIRQGRNVGYKTFCFENDNDIEIGEINLSQLIMRFYNKRNTLVPQCVIIHCAAKNCMINARELQSALISYSANNVKVKIINEYKPFSAMLDFMKTNALASLTNKKQNILSNSELFIELLEQLGFYDILHKLEKQRSSYRIEVYDNSHISGNHALGCMIVAGSSGFIKEQYRVFKFSADISAKGDDYSMLKDMLERRIATTSIGVYPDFVLIDGGKRHLAIAQTIFKNLGTGDIKIVSLAKGINRSNDTLYTSDGTIIDLVHKDKVLHYLQRLRDEAHRFAIISHRKLRHKNTIKSTVSLIPGIGPKRQKLLLSIFGSHQNLHNATLQELQSISGIGQKCAINIYNYLNCTKHS